MKSVKLNPNTSLKALETKAHRAAAMANNQPHAGNLQSKERVASKPENNPNKKLRSNTHSTGKGRGRQIAAIEHAIMRIREHLHVEASGEVTVLYEKPSKGVSSKGTLTLFKRADITKQLEEENRYRELLNEGKDKNSLPKPFKAKPYLKYVFYPHILDVNQLGSIAIYGNEDVLRQTLANHRVSIFGYMIKSVNIEIGLRPFLDIELRLGKV